MNVILVYTLSALNLVCDAGLIFRSAGTHIFFKMVLGHSQPIRSEAFIKITE